MEIREQHLKIPTLHPVYTVNELTPATQNVWIVCHGYGQLARYFVKRFDILPAQEHFIIAPQGLNRFYLDGEYGKVGASWMTREDRESELINQRQYFETIFSTYLSKVDWQKIDLNFFGFSQGVPLSIRIAACMRLPVKRMIFWAGDLPKEVQKEDFSFLRPDASIELVIGDQDKFFNIAVIEKQKAKVSQLTGIEPRLTIFDGKHEVKREVLKKLID